MKHPAALPLGLLLLFVAPGAAEEVRFKTSDGLEIVGDFHRAGRDAPTVVCIPMYRHARATYEPLIGPLLRKGINVLALDTRGHGESAPQLKDRVRGRDAQIFNEMHQDVEAAIGFLEREKGCDATRVGLVGASVGCSVAVDVTVRHPELVRGVVLLTPGSRYLGVPTLEHLRRWPGTRIFAFTSTEEERKSKGVLDALKPFQASSYAVVPGKGIHGTRMFGRVAGIEETLADFMESSLVGSVDLRVPQWAEGDPAVRTAGFFRRTLRPRRKVGGATYTLMVYAEGDAWTLGGLVDKPFQGKLRFQVGDDRIEFPLDTSRRGGKVVGQAKGGRKVEGSRAAAGEVSWITFPVDDPSQGEGGVPIVLEFRPRKGKVVRLPGGAARFAAFLQAVAGGDG
ncbi:MAG: alpha/beta hydrolase [Planctomycetota bacterium]